MSELRDRVARMVRRIYGASASVQTLDRLSGGASQETYRLELEVEGESLVLALRRAAGGEDHGASGPHPGLETEALLFRAALAAGVPEPEILGVLEIEDELGPGFLLEWLDGETLGPRINRTERFAAIRPKLARQCGEILARIHSIDVEATNLASKLSVQSPEEFVRETWGNYRKLDTVQPMIDYTAHWLLANLPPEKPPQLVHNDFRNGNLMVDPERGVIAVLDWELAHLGDPMRDLGWVCCNSWRFGSDLPVGGFGRREDLFAGYEEHSGQPVDRTQVLFWEVFGSFWWAVGTLGMAQHFRSGPDGSVERVSIGRRTSECQMDCVNLLFPGAFHLEPRETEATDLAHTSELIQGVRDFLRSEVMPQTEGRLSFLSRVAANSLDIALREQAQEGAHLRAESERLDDLGYRRPAGTSEAALRQQRRALVRALDAGDQSLEDAALTAHLRQTVAQQLAIDQPGYSALKPREGAH